MKKLHSGYCLELSRGRLDGRGVGGDGGFSVRIGRAVAERDLLLLAECVDERGMRCACVDEMPLSYETK